MHVVLKYIIILFSLILGVVDVYAQYELATIPNPKKQGKTHFVSNPNGYLRQETVAKLDEISTRIDSLYAAEYAIVILDDYQGDDDFQFALDLFNTWGIGKVGANNGLLLFVAVSRREYRFISGYGMERIFPDVYLKRLGEKYLVPAFKEQDYDEGILKASMLIEQVLNAKDVTAELESLLPTKPAFFSRKNVPVMNSLFILLCFSVLYVYTHFVSRKIVGKTRKKLVFFAPVFWGLGCFFFLQFISLFIFVFIFDNLSQVYSQSNLPYFSYFIGSLILGFKIYDTREFVTTSFGDEQDKQKGLTRYFWSLCIPMLISPIAWFDIIKLLRRFQANRGRFDLPDGEQNWIRINRSDKKGRANSYLSNGQKLEEKIGSLQYEVWKDPQNNRIKLIPWALSKSFDTCPKCHFRTLAINKKRDLRPATSRVEGKGEIYDGCSNCSYYIAKKIYVIPIRSSGGSAGGSSGGGSSSRGGSSSSSSFGGGSSGGGGAGGRW